MIKSKKKLSVNFEVVVFNTGHKDHFIKWGKLKIVGLTGKGFHIDTEGRPCLSLTEKTAKKLAQHLNKALKGKAK